MKFAFLLLSVILLNYLPLTAQVDTLAVKVEKQLPEKIHKVTDRMPRFPGCEDIAGNYQFKIDCSNEKLLAFIQKNIQYPQTALEQGIEGRCYVTFVIEKNGSVSNIELIKDIGEGCGEEALRVTGLMQTLDIRWTPGGARGRNVRIQFNMPVEFKIPVEED